jgi:hypothetical protein
MPSLAEIMKYAAPAIGFAAGAANPRAADALNDLVSMRQAFKDRERRMRREDESDERQRAAAARQARSAEIAEEEYALQTEQRRESDAQTEAFMRNLPSRYRDDPRVMQLARDGDIGKAMELINSDVQKQGLSSAILSQIAQNAPQYVDPMRASVEAAPQMYGPLIQKLAGQMAPEELAMTMQQFMALGQPPAGASFSATVEAPGGGELRATRYGESTRGTGRQPKPYERESFILSTNEDFVKNVNEIADSMILYSKRTGSASMTSDEKEEAIDDARKRYLKLRDNYLKESREFPEGYRVPYPSWEDVKKGEPIKWKPPKGTTEKKKETKKGGEQEEPKLSAAELRALRIDQLNRKAAEPGGLTNEEYQELVRLEAESD